MPYQIHSTKFLLGRRRGWVEEVIQAPERRAAAPRDSVAWPGGFRTRAVAGRGRDFGSFHVVRRRLSSVGGAINQEENQEQKV